MWEHVLDDTASSHCIDEFQGRLVPVAGRNALKEIGNLSSSGRGLRWSGLQKDGLNESRSPLATGSGSIGRRENAGEEVQEAFKSEVV